MRMRTRNPAQNMPRTPPNSFTPSVIMLQPLATVYMFEYRVGCRHASRRFPRS